MSISARLASVFFAHVAFLFGAYGSRFFGLHLPYTVAIAIWLGLSSFIAALAYRSAFSKSPVFAGELLSAVSGVGATCVSLAVGVFLAVNTFGT